LEAWCFTSFIVRVVSASRAQASPSIAVARCNCPLVLVLST
jgi:hypothetical protein